MVLVSSVLRLRGAQSVLRYTHRIPSGIVVAHVSNGNSAAEKSSPGINGPPVILSFQKRFKNHGAKMGLHLQTLEELAHRKRHEEAVEKRRIKKEKNQARKSGHKQTTQSSPAVEFHEDNDFDVEEEEEEEEERKETKEGGLDESEEPSLPDVEKIEERMDRIADKYIESLSAIRGAEPTLAIFDHVTVNAYGDPRTPLQAVAQVVITTSTMAHATCYDPALAKNVDAAIRMHLSLNPRIEEGGVVKIPLPRPSLESRQKSVQQLHKRTETTRQRIRNIRRDALHLTKQGVAGKLVGVSKDDAFRVQQDLEKVTEKIIDKVNQAMTEKEKSIMSV